MTRVGLTGNYGMGKSSVLRAFGELGALTIDTDEIVARLLGEKPVLQKIRELLGDSVFESGGGLLKDRVAEEIFSHDDKKKALEELLHPLVFSRMEEMISSMEEETAGHPSMNMTGIVVVEVPLLFEGGYEGRFQKTITVYCDETTAIERLEQGGVEHGEAVRRITSQMPIEEKIRRSDFIIENTGPFEETRKRVRQIYEILKENPEKPG